jgi:hypothetical protein
MQILGLADSTPKPDNRLKSLFWPTIRTRVDLDTVTTQGFWICALVGCVTAALACVTGNALDIFLGAFGAVFYVLAGFGVRMQSRVAATAAFAMYLLDGVAMQVQTGRGFGVMRLIFLAVLLANVRGIWLSASFQPAESDPPPTGLDENWRDKLVDQWPAAIWPWGRYVFYILAALGLGLAVLGMLAQTLRLV